MIDDQIIAHMMPTASHENSDRMRLYFMIDAQANETYREAIDAALDEAGHHGAHVSQVEYRSIITACVDQAIAATGYAIAEGTVQ
jgi:hypothetical protein